MDASRSGTRHRHSADYNSDYYNEIAERMNLNHLDLICEALDCEPDEILVRVPNPEPRVRNRTGFEKPATESKVGI